MVDLTREEKIKLYRRRQMLNAAQTAQPEAAPERTLSEDIYGGVNAALQGATLNFADEIGAGVGAAAAKMFGDTDESYSDIYSSMMESEKGKREAFAEANPKTALGLEVAGGFTTGGVGGAKVLGAKALNNTQRTIVKNALRKTAGKAKAVKEAAVKAALRKEAGKKAAAISAVGAGEGALAGFGSGDTLDERLSGAGTGATIGAALPVALNVAGRGARAASNKFKLKDKLPVDAAGNQMPLSLADETGGRGKFYREIVGDAYGGGSLEKQAQPFIQQADEAVVKQTDLLEDTIAAGKRNIEDVVASGKRNVRTSEQAIRANAQSGIDDLDAAFRIEATKNSLPANITPELVASLDGKSAQETVSILNQAWRGGFDVVTKPSTRFAVKPDSFKKYMSNLFDDDPALKQAAKDYVNDVASDFKKAFNTKTGDISGADVMEIRNKYARAANKTADPLQRGAFGRIKTTIDDLIEEGLPPEDLAKYKVDKAAYGSFNNLKNATGKAGNRKGGDFTVDEWLSSTKNNYLASGSGVMQDVAQGVQKQRTVLKKSIAQAIKDNPDKIAAVQAKSRATESLVKSKRAIRDSVAEAKQRLQFLTHAGKASEHTGSKMLSTAALGSLPALAGGHVGGLASGAGVAKLLSTPRMQRVVAGQSVDEILDKLGRSQLGGMSSADILRQGAGAAGGILDRYYDY